MADGSSEVDVVRSRCDEEAEEAVIGAVMLDPACIAQIGFLRPEDFYFPKHGVVWSAMQQLALRHEPIDTVTVCAELRAMQRLNTVGGVQDVSRYQDLAVTSAHVERYARMVAELAVARRIEFAHFAGLAKARDPSVRVPDLAAFSIAAVTSASQRNHELKPVEMRDVAIEAYESIEHTNDPEQVGGIPTGLHELDDLIGAFYPQKFYIVAGRPAMGKSSFGVLAARACSAVGKRALFFSIEMPRTELFMRVACELAMLDSKKTRRRGAMSQDEFDVLTEGMNKASKLLVHIDDDPRVTALTIRERAMRFMAEHPADKDAPLGMIVVDYLQKLKAPRDGRRDRGRENEVREATEELHAIGKELNVPMVALAQLNRDLEDRKDKRPELQDIRESGSIEQEADVVMFLYRDEYYDKQSLDRGIVEINVAKQRGGDTDVVPMAFDKVHTRFANLTQEAAADWRERRQPKTKRAAAPGSYAERYAGAADAAE